MLTNLKSPWCFQLCWADSWLASGGAGSVHCAHCGVCPGGNPGAGPARLFRPTAGEYSQPKSSSQTCLLNYTRWDLAPEDVWSVRATGRTKWLQPRSCLKVKVHVFKEKLRFVKQRFSNAHIKSTFMVSCGNVSVVFGFPCALSTLCMN